MATMNQQNYLNFTTDYTTAATNISYPIAGFTTFAPGYALGGMRDPLGQIPATPRAETEKEWLRRRVNETLWRAA